nr:hypothetical protein [Lysinibacillus timonensis]
MENYKKMIELLKNGEIDSIEVPKDAFLEFRSILVKDELFKHFRGIAQQGGNVIYTFLEKPRS